MNLRVSVYATTLAHAALVQAAALQLLGEPITLTPQQAYDRDGPVGPITGYAADLVLSAAQIQGLLSAPSLLLSLPMVWNARLDEVGAAAADFASFWSAAQAQNEGFLESIGHVPPRDPHLGVQYIRREPRRMMTWMVAALALTQTPIPEFGPELARRLESGASVIDFGGQTYRISSPVISRGLSRRHIRNLRLIDATRPPANVPDYFISRPTVAWGMMNARDVRLENIQLDRPAWMGLGFIGGSNLTLRGVTITGGQGGRHPRHHVVANRVTNLTIEGSRFVAGPQHDGELVGVGTGVPIHFRPNDRGELEAIEPHWRLETNFPAWIGTPDEVRLVRATGGQTLTIRYAGLSEIEGPADRHPLRWQVFWPGMDPAWSVRPIQRDSRAKTITLALRGSREASFPEGWVTWAAWNPAGMAQGLTVRRTTFVGAGGKLAGLQRGSAGLSAYWVRNILIEDNTATGFPDYGLGWEWCENITVRGNRASGNQEGYNQYEFVGRTRSVVFERNEGQLGFVPHGWPVEFVSVSHAGRVLVAGMDQLDPSRPPRRAALAIGWFQSVTVNGQPLGRPFLSIPPEILRQRGLLPDR